MLCSQHLLADITVNFFSPNVTVNENNGTVTVCVIRDRLTQTDLTVPITLTTGSADSKREGGREGGKDRGREGGRRDRGR